MEVKHLWEVDHPYYCNESNYFSGGMCTHYATWKEFIAEFGDADFDMNLVFRWDWKLPIDSNDDKPILNPDPYYRDGRLKVFWMGQRKGKFFSSEVSVCQSDEPEVRKFLQPRLNHLMLLWSPLLPTPGEGGAA